MVALEIRHQTTRKRVRDTQIQALRVIRVPPQDVLFNLILWYIAKIIPTLLDYEKIVM